MSEHDDKALRARLAEAESITEALRTGEIDAVVGEKQVLLLRLREVEEALQRSEARYRGLVEDQADLVYRWNPQGQLTFVNEAFCRFFQRPREDLLGTSVGLPIPGGAGPDDLQAQLRALGDEQPFLDQEHRVERPTGEFRWLHVMHRLILSEEGKPAEIQSVARDVTERKRAEEQLRQVNVELERRVDERTAQLRGLIRDLDEAEQKERRRLAQFLHDDLQQLLVASKFNVATLRQEGLGDSQQRALDRAEDLIDRSITASRSLVSQLSPPALRREGLVAALHWLGDQMQEMHGLRKCVRSEV
ncbi:MAG: PAS domain S-box protein [Phycisphaeraceae bacterium]